jgi:hypothetical protein
MHMFLLLNARSITSAARSSPRICANHFLEAAGSVAIARILSYSPNQLGETFDRQTSHFHEFTPRRDVQSSQRRLVDRTLWGLPPWAPLVPVACRGANITRFRIWAPNAVLAQSTAFEHEQRRCAASAPTNSPRPATSASRCVIFAHARCHDQKD